MGDAKTTNETTTVTLEEFIANLNRMVDVCTVDKSVCGIWDIPIPSKETLSNLENALKETYNTATKLTNLYISYLSFADKTVNDIEHAVVFSDIARQEGRSITDYFTGGVLPECLKDVDEHHYLEKLSEALTARRQIKDCGMVCKAVRDKLQGIVSFMGNMNTRVYTPTASNPPKNISNTTGGEMLEYIKQDPNITHVGSKLAYDDRLTHGIISVVSDKKSPIKLDMNGVLE